MTYMSLVVAASDVPPETVRVRRVADASAVLRRRTPEIPLDEPVPLLVAPLTDAPGVPARDFACHHPRIFLIVV